MPRLKNGLYCYSHHGVFCGRVVRDKGFKGGKKNNNNKKKKKKNKMQKSRKRKLERKTEEDPEIKCNVVR